MEEKNELNDLFLGEETKNNGSKKLFLIIAGALLVFFVTIGIMKFVNSGEDKAQNTNATKETNTSAQRATTDANGSAAATMPNDEKLNEIVRKLQEDAKNQASQTTPLDTNAAVQPKTTVVTVPTQPTPAPAVTPTQAPKPAPKVATPTPVAPTPAAQPVQAAAQQAQKATAVPATATVATPKEALDAVKEPAKPAPKPKPVAKPAPKPVAKPAPAVAAQDAPAQPAAQSNDGGYYVQVGYYDGQKNVDSLATKVSSAGYKTSNRTAQVKDKNVTKVLAGPFNSKAEAQTELTKIRQQIKADAFITK